MAGTAAPPEAQNSLFPELPRGWSPTASVKRHTSIKRSESETVRRQEQEAEMYNRRGMPAALLTANSVQV